MTLICKKFYTSGYKRGVNTGESVVITQLSPTMSRIDTENGEFIDTILNAELSIYFKTNKGMF